MKINCLIIDDELLSRRRLQHMIDDTPILNCIGECRTGKEAILTINKVRPDLIFLDIQMKDMSGFNVLQKLLLPLPMVIFVTAYDKYAIKAFDFCAFDYLLKPFKRTRFTKSIERVVEFLDQNSNSKFEKKLNKLLNYFENMDRAENLDISINKFPIKIGKSTSFIGINSIKYIRASGSYIDLQVDGKTYVLRTSLNDVLIKLNNPFFFRIHRSTIINVNYVEKFIHSSYNEIDAKMMDGSIFRIGHSYKKDLLKVMKL